MRRPLLGIVTLLVLTEASLPPSVAQSTPAPPPMARKEPCQGARFHEFDFWLGKWTVRRPDGRMAGANTITSEEAGCAIVEHWTSAAGGTGQSLNFYDPAADRWRQVWVGLGLVLTMQGGLVNGSMVLEGPLQYLADARVTRLRGIWTPLADGRVRQEFLESVDGGQTWALWFDGYYARTEVAR